MIGRREFMTLLGGAAAWSCIARAQPRERIRRIGILSGLASDDPAALARITAFAQELAQLGWTVGRNMQIDYRWGAGDGDRIRRYAVELAALTPDVVLAYGSGPLAALQRVSRAIPIVFVQVIDPVGASFVDSLARPGGSTTGFTVFEYGIGGKWLELLKAIAPGVTRVAVLRDPGIAAGSGQLGAIQSVAPSFGVELRPVDAREAGEIERAVTAFANAPNGGMIVTGSGVTLLHRELIATLARRHR